MYLSRSTELSVVAIVSLLCWSIFVIHHPFHDHQLALISLDVLGGDSLGRFGFKAFAGLIADADIIVWNYIVALACMLTMYVVLIERMQLDKTSSIIFGIVFVCNPIWAGIFYYHDLVAMALLALLFAVSSACLPISTFGAFASSILLIICLSIYQPALNIYPIAVALLVLSDALRDRSTIPGLLIKVGAKIAILIASLVLYFLVVRITGTDGSFATSVTGKALDLGRIFMVFRSMFDHFWITQPDFPLRVRIFELVALFVGIALMLTQVASNSRRALAILLIIGLLISSKAMFLIVDRYGEQLIYQYRYNLGRPLLIAGIITIGLAQILKTKSAHRSWPAFFIIVSTVLSVIYIQQSLIRQTVLLHGQRVDMSIMQRVLTRLENSGMIDPDKSYQFVRTGPLSTVRQDMLIAQNGPSTKIADEHMDYGSIGNAWVPESLFYVLGSSYDLKQNTINNWVRRTHIWRQVALENGIEPWPAKGSLFINGNNIVLHTWPNN